MRWFGSTPIIDKGAFHRPSLYPASNATSNVMYDLGISVRVYKTKHTTLMHTCIPPEIAFFLFCHGFSERINTIGHRPKKKRHNSIPPNLHPSGTPCTSGAPSLCTPEITIEKGKQKDSLFSRRHISSRLHVLQPGYQTSHHPLLSRHFSSNSPS